MPLSVKKVTISNFRGISLPLELNFYKGNKANSVLIMGRNGSGKSSIVDAWEWFYKGSIEHLKREGVTTNDYPHKLCQGNNCFLEVEFTDTTIRAAKLSFNPKKVSTPTPSAAYNQFITGGYIKHPFYLRYRDLQDFVYKTKKDKYTYLAHFFGLSQFTFLQDALQLTLTKFDQKIGTEDARGSDAKQKLFEMLGDKTSITDENVLKEINKQLQKNKISVIEDFKGVKPSLALIKDIIDKNPLAKEQIEWQAVNSSMSNMLNLKLSKSDAIEMEKLFSILKASEKSLTQLFISQLYEKGLQILPKLEDPNICPLCDKEFNGDLLQHIKTKHEKLQEIIQVKSQFDNLHKNLLEVCKTISSKLNILLDLKDVPDGTFIEELVSLAKTMQADCKFLLATLESDILSNENLVISSIQIFDNLSRFNALIEAVLQKIQKRIDDLKRNSQGSSLVESYSIIRDLATAYFSFKLASERLQHLQTVKKQYETILDKLGVYITFTIQTIFNTISSDVITYFNILEDNHRYLKNPQLVLMEGKNKAVELSIEFSGDAVIPAYKYLSESQVNSFGLAIFLASVKQFNPGFKFVILDDVVNSFDVQKRPRIISLIANHFSDFQFLVSTHDDIFFEQMSRAFQQWERLKFTSWDFRNGPTYQLGMNYVERIENAIANDDATIAGQQLGQYLEWIFGVLCEAWKVKTEHKQDNQYTLSELFDPLKTKIISQLKKDKHLHKMVMLLEEFENPSGFRNYSAHYKNAVTNYTCPEIKTILDKWKEIEALLYCTTSKSYVRYSKNGNVESLMCACGKLNLKEDQYYIAKV